MKIEPYEPRNIVKEHAALYREHEERRIDFENYHNWLYSHLECNINPTNTRRKTDLEAFNEYVERVKAGKTETTV